MTNRMKVSLSRCSADILVHQNMIITSWNQECKNLRNYKMTPPHITKLFLFAFLSNELVLTLITDHAKW